VIFGHHSTLAHGRKSRRGWISWYASTACVGLAGLISRRRSVLGYRIAKLRARHPDWFRDDLLHLVELLREHKIHPGSPPACRSLTLAGPMSCWGAPRSRGSWSWCREAIGSCYSATARVALRVLALLCAKGGRFTSGAETLARDDMQSSTSAPSSRPPSHERRRIRAGATTLAADEERSARPRRSLSQAQRRRIPRV
jgi:hypothetical protein